MWKRAGPCFDYVVRRAVFIIHAANRGRSEGRSGEEIFWSNRKLICGWGSLARGSFCYWGEWAGRLAVCIIHTHTWSHSHTCKDIYAEKHTGRAHIHFLRQICMHWSHWDVVCYSSKPLLHPPLRPLPYMCGGYTMMLACDLWKCWFNNLSSLYL